MQLYNQSLEISRRLGYQSMIARTLNNIALIHDKKGEYDQAMQLYNQSLEIKKRLGISNE
jgi:tetratricopeptide (TPR) repeat protein